MKPHQAVGIILLTSEDLNKKVSFFNYIFFSFELFQKISIPLSTPYHGGQWKFRGEWGGVQKEAILKAEQGVF